MPGLERQRAPGGALPTDRRWAFYIVICSGCG